MKLSEKLIFPGIALLAALVALIFFFNKALTVGAPKHQDPSFPLSYYAEDVVFRNEKDGVTLAGTLTLPAKHGMYPVVVLITGSGPQNRDEEIAGHRPFLVLADHLTKNGVGVLRYDDRGVGESTGKFRMSNLDDVTSDVKSAIAYLQTRKEIDPKHIGLIGHSEGGIIAPRVAMSSEDVSFIVLLAGPGIKLAELLPLQQQMIAKAAGATDADAAYVRLTSSEMFQMVLDNHDNEVLTGKLTTFANANWDRIKRLPILPENITKEKYTEMITHAMTAYWLRNLLLVDPASILEKVKCPVLALNGEKDVQVPPKENLAGIRDALTRGGNNSFVVKALPGLNHLFQECETGAISEYAAIQQTLSPVAMMSISEWVLEQVREPRPGNGTEAP